MSQATRPNPRFPDVPEERLLCCWRCRQWLPVHHYDYGRDLNPSPGLAELMRLALDSIEHGHRRACGTCIDLFASTAASTNESDCGGGRWMLEVQVAVEGAPIRCTVFRHVGYMRKGFASKAEAAAYYAEHNPHMRAIDAAHQWCSDWDPHTHRRYVVRRQVFPDAEQTIDPF